MGTKIEREQKREKANKIKEELAFAFIYLFICSITQRSFILTARYLVIQQDASGCNSTCQDDLAPGVGGWVWSDARLNVFQQF